MGTKERVYNVYFNGKSGVWNPVKAQSPVNAAYQAIQTKYGHKGLTSRPDRTKHPETEGLTSSLEMRGITVRELVEQEEEYEVVVKQK